MDAVAEAAINERGKAMSDPDNVIRWPGVTKLDLPASRVLEEALAAGLSGCIVVGLTEGGDEYYASSYAGASDGGIYVEMDERMTSQVCSACGSLPASRPKGIADLGIREWTCDDCGAVHDRDVNAAKNILRLGLESLEEGAAQMRSSQSRNVG